VFARGFIRAYLRYLGLAADEALAFYQARVEASLPPPPKDAVRAGWRRYVPVAACLGAAAVLSLGLYAYVALTRPSSPPPEAQPASVRQSTLSSLGESPAPAPASPAVEPKRAALRLVARVIEPTWLRVQTDSGQTTQELLPASAVREWTARSRFVLTIGNAGGVRLELNGTPLPPLGSSGEVIRDLVLPRPAPQETQ
jgi:cytoskeletal protein RodZ